MYGLCMLLEGLKRTTELRTQLSVDPILRLSSRRDCEPDRVYNGHSKKIISHGAKLPLPSISLWRLGYYLEHYHIPQAWIPRRWVNNDGFLVFRDEIKETWRGSNQLLYFFFVDLKAVFNSGSSNDVLIKWTRQGVPLKELKLRGIYQRNILIDASVTGSNLLSQTKQRYYLVKTVFNLDDILA